MSDIKKALDAYKRASGKKDDDKKENSDTNTSEKINVKKYVFSKFNTEKTTNPKAKEGSSPLTRKEQEMLFKDILDDENLFKEEPLQKQEKVNKKGNIAPPVKDVKEPGFVKLSRVPEKEEKEAEKKTVSDKDLKKYEKAAKVLLLLGKEEAASVIKHFKPEEIEKIASCLIKIKTIDKDEAAALLKEINKKGFIKETFSGGVETARQMLHTAFGKQKGEQLLYKALPEAREKPFEFLQDLEPHKIKLALKDEPVTVISVVMNYLEPQKSATLLKEYTKEEQKQILLRMASGGKIPREVFEKMEKIIKEKVRLQGNVVTQRIDGRSKLANILKFMDIKEEEEIIKNISEFDPDLSKEIEDQVYTIDIILKISEKDLHKIFNSFSDKEVAVILKGQEEGIKTKILSSLSQTRQELVRHESSYLGIMRKSEVNIAVRELIDYIKQAEKDGAVVIDRSGDLVV
ncbi:MAG: hypothetical protein FWD87_09655 [Spirochaetaceae bacterium]|nr:hypothetical protein [Spirochaetaceae bacterium]